MTVARKADPKSRREGSLRPGSIAVLALICPCPPPAPRHSVCCPPCAGPSRGEGWRAKGGDTQKMDRGLQQRLGWEPQAMSCRLTYYGSVQRAGNVIPRERYLGSSMSRGSESFRLRIWAAGFKHLGAEQEAFLGKILVLETGRRPEIINQPWVTMFCQRRPSSPATRTEKTLKCSAGPQRGINLRIFWKVVAR